MFLLASSSSPVPCPVERSSCGPRLWSCVTSPWRHYPVKIQNTFCLLKSGPPRLPEEVPKSRTKSFLGLNRAKHHGSSGAENILSPDLPGSLTCPEDHGDSHLCTALAPGKLLDGPRTDVLRYSTSGWGNDRSV